MYTVNLVWLLVPAGASVQLSSVKAWLGGRVESQMVSTAQLRKLSKKYGQSIKNENSMPKSTQTRKDKSDRKIQSLIRPYIFPQKNKM